MPFTEWDRTFTDPRLCAAIADRLTFKGILIQTGSESFRPRATEAEHPAETARNQRLGTCLSNSST
ncbi:ATP-binding protein [Embleya scabrispora]|uniref:ATP-binding protein n=1 Tax=Embleya scabrispora TaxID=159449 RepID=UPI002AA5D367